MTSTGLRKFIIQLRCRHGFRMGPTEMIETTSRLSQCMYSTSIGNTEPENKNSMNNVSSIEHSEETKRPRLVCFGGSGFVGSRVVEAALGLGADVTSISRSGRPSIHDAPWLNRVRWIQGDALDPQMPWKDELKGADGIVSTLGAFGSNEFMYKMCGESNMQLMDIAKEIGVPRFTFISVHDFKLPRGWNADNFLLKGYFQGKRDAESHLKELFTDTGVALRPGFIYGKRRVSGGYTIPLHIIGSPLQAVLKLLPTQKLCSIPILGGAFVPPVSVESVGRAAAATILDADRVSPGIMDVWTILKF